MELSYKLESFEGPLDLLLHLIEKNKVNIYISLAIFAVMAVLAFKKVHPILIICMSAVAGIVVGYGFDLKV